MHDCIIVGSGPAGVAAASALLRRGRRVLMLDGGMKLEAERQKVVDRMAQTEATSWTAEQLAMTREGMEPGPEGIPLKRLFGSDFPYRDIEKFAELECRQSNITMSLALGGLSNVWGAAVPPFASDDISDWPITTDDLTPFYRECLGEMHLSARADDLQQNYPLHTDAAVPLRLTRQAQSFLADLERHRARLNASGLTFGQARLGVKAVPSGPTGGCVYCGQCLYGCPYGYIYNSADYVKRLQGNSSFQYQPDVVVVSLQESAGEVTVHATHRVTGEKLSFSGAKLFLACGAIPTTAIMLEAMGHHDRPVEMKDSQYFLVPALRFKGTPGVIEEPLHTLTQLFLELRDASLSAKAIHISVYTYNDLLLEALRKQTGPVGKLFPAVPKMLAGRMLVMGGYLHSNESPSLEFTLSKCSDGKRKILLQGMERPESERIVRKLMNRLLKYSTTFKAVPLVPFMKRGLPGRGFHVGGTFPMTRQPREMQSDLLGRPHGFARVHLADATCFPNVPAPNLTLTVMANARRIADGACKV